MPFGSTNVLTRPQACASDAADTLGAIDGSVNAVICFQEAWSFRCGLAWPIIQLAMSLEQRAGRQGPRAMDEAKGLLEQIWELNQHFTLFALVCGLISALFLPVRYLRWDGTKAGILRRLAASGLCYHVGSGGGAGAPWFRLMDSGLLMVSTRPAGRHGFVPFAARGSEGMATKGMLWALFPATDGGEGGHLVVTTHLHATDAGIRVAQCAQLLEEVKRLCAELHPALVLLCGDFNEEPGGAVHAALGAPPLSLARLTDARGAGTCVERRGDALYARDLDHIYAAALPPRRACLGSLLAPVFSRNSDHALVGVCGLRAL
jgi:hypothetical protein